MYLAQTHKFSTELIAVNYQTNETIDLTKSVKTIAVHNNYLENVYPLYHIALELSEDNRKKLSKNLFYLSLKIYRSTILENSELNTTETTPDTPITDKVIVDILLRPYGKPKISMQTKKSDLEDSNNTPDDTKEQQLVSYSLNSIPLEPIRFNNKILNNCYQNININEAIINTISEVYTDKLYYQESKNITRYDSLLIPPMSLIQILKYLQENYIIYNNILSIFFDDKKLFIYDIKSLDRQYINTFTINIETDSGTIDQTKYSQTFIDENNNLKKTLDKNLVSFNNSEILNYINGDSIMYNSYDDNYNLVIRQYNSNVPLKKDDKKIRVHWNADKFDSFEKRNLALFTNFIQLSLNNIDPSLIDPDTRISIFGSSYEEDNGEYALINKDVYYTTEDNINFNESVVLNLGKK